MVELDTTRRCLLWVEFNYPSTLTREIRSSDPISSLLSTQKQFRPPTKVLLVQELDRRRRLEDGFDDVDFDDEDDYDEDETDEDAEARMRKHASRTAGKTQTPSHHQWWNVLEKFFRGNDSRAEREGDGGDCGDDVDGGGGGVRGWRRMKLLHDRLTAAAAASTEATMHI